MPQTIYGFVVTDSDGDFAFGEHFGEGNEVVLENENDDVMILRSIAYTTKNKTSGSGIVAGNKMELKSLEAYIAAKLGEGAQIHLIKDDVPINEDSAWENDLDEHEADFPGYEAQALDVGTPATNADGKAQVIIGPHTFTRGSEE